MLSRTVGRFAQIEKPKIVATQFRDWFAARYKLNLAEAELPVEQYPSLAKLFTRKLKPGARPLGAGIVHPCDAELTRAENIEGNSIIQAKGHQYKLSDFLKISPDEVIAKFTGGLALTYYLCPTDYHRVHAPIDCDVEAVTHVPGALWPVNKWSVENVENLFAVNERVIFWLRTPFGPAALVMVGATNVGQISVSVGSEEFRRDFATNSPFRTAPISETFERAAAVKKGDELGVFNMGSTVIVIYPSKCLNVMPHLGAVKMGVSL